MAFTRAWNVADPADTDAWKLGAQEIREFKVDVEERLEKWFGGSIANSIDTDAAVALLASNRALWFYENAAPTGWTIVAAAGDELLAVKGGSTYTTGGANAGAWTHAHTMSEHTHPLTLTAVAATGNTANVSAGANTGICSPANTSANTAFRPLARVGVICTKD